MYFELSHKMCLVYDERRVLRNTKTVVSGVIYTLSWDLKLRKIQEVFSRCRKYPYEV
jgi:hypothetical protein